jgi:hypothetical protein
MLWTGGPGMPGTNTVYAAEGDVAIADARNELEAFYDAWATNHCANDLTVTIPNTGDIIDTTNGDLIGVWNDRTPITIPGTLSAERVPRTTQLLVQMHTDLVVSSRRLHGRLFLPGVVEPDSDDGVPSAGLLSSTISAATTCFVDDFAIYSPTHNTWATITGVDVWREFAVLRSRRD